MVVVSAGHVGGTRGSGIVSSAVDMLWMSVVHGMRGGVGRVCEMYVFGSGRRGWRGGECMRGFGFGFPNPEGTGRVLDVVSVFLLRWCMWGVGRG